MKVAFFADVGLAGGAAKSMIELVCTLKQNHDIQPVVFTSQQSRMNEMLDQEGIENHSVGHGAFMQGAPDSWWKKPIKWMLCAPKYYLKYSSSVRKALNSIDWNEVDLIHTNSARVDIGMEVSRKTGVPNICHIREFAELDFNCWSYRPGYVKYLKRKTDGFIAISEAVKKYWIQKGLPEQMVSVIYNGVDHRKIKKADRTEWKTDKELRLVIAGGVIPNKGQWQAIEAVCRLPENIRNHVTLDIIGGITEPYKKKISTPLLKAGMTDRVRFLGAQDNVFSLYQNYHIGLMCSKAEGFGRVTVEYMHAGLAVIASDTGANPELINDGVTGILYSKTDTDSLTKAIIKLYDDRELLLRLSENGEKMAAQNFTKEINAAAIYDYYQNSCHRLLSHKS